MRLKTLAFGLVVLVLLGFSATAVAQLGGGYDLSWNTIDGGGGNATGGSYTLDGTLGQADAGTVSGGSYTLNGGYWPEASPTSVTIYLSFIRR